MHSEIPERNPQKQLPDIKTYIPAFITAGICVLLVRIGLLSFFFLVPLGFAAYRYEYKIAWAASIFAILGNAVLLMGSAFSPSFPPAVVFWNFVHFTAMISIFAWITAPPPHLAEKVPLSVRFLTGYSIGAVILIVFFFGIMAAPGFSEYVAALLNAMIPQNARSELMTVDIILEVISSVFLRGGSLIVCAILFTFSRQVSLLFARIIPGKTRNSDEMMSLYFRRVNSLESFRVNPSLIWILSSSLLLVVLTRISGLEIPEIILWNILVLCTIMYLAQGLGILQFFLSRPSISPFLKLVFLILILILFFSPFLNMILLVGLVLLGIAENWVPFRVPKENDIPSTPEGGS